LVIDNAGTTHPMWTYGGTIPGPLVRVTEGDTVDFTLINDAGNQQSHSMDFHAARADVLDEFEAIKPGDVKKFTFKAEYPGVFIYRCGADAMAEHISRGMYGVVIVDPKEGYTSEYPKPDREYVIVHGDLFEAGTSAEDITQGHGWKGVLVNGKVFHYDPRPRSEREPDARVRARRARPDLFRERHDQRVRGVPPDRRHLGPGLGERPSEERSVRDANRRGPAGSRRRPRHREPRRPRVEQRARRSPDEARDAR